MSGRPGPRSALSRAAEEHRQAIADCAEAIRRVDPSDWKRAPAERKWIPAEIAEHLAACYDPLLSELEGGPGFRRVVPWWKRRIFRWRFLPGILAERFPPGVPAPREIRPAETARSPEDGARRLLERSGVFLERFVRAGAEGKARLTHPYIGRLSGAVALRFLTSHVDHHHRQLPNEATDRD